MFRREFFYHSPTLSVSFVLSTLNRAEILCMVLTILAFNPSTNVGFHHLVDPTFYNIYPKSIIPITLFSSPRKKKFYLYLHVIFCSLKLFVYPCLVAITLLSCLQNLLYLL